MKLVTVAGYEKELKSVLVDSFAATKDNALALARTRTAWRSSRVQLHKAEAKKAQGVPAEELDDPLPPATQDAFISQRKKRYALELQVHLQPADALVGWLYREELRRSMPARSLLPSSKG